MNKLLCFRFKTYEQDTETETSYQLHLLNRNMLLDTLPQLELRFDPDIVSSSADDPSTLTSTAASTL